MCEKENSEGKVKKIYGKWTEFAEAWVEFEDKKMAKLVARILNGTKVPQKYLNNRMAKGHMWNMKYLKGFKWHHLLEHKEQMRILERKKFEKAISEAHKQANYFKQQIKKSQELKDTFGPMAPSKRTRKDIIDMAQKAQNKDLEAFMPSDGEEDSGAVAADDVIALGDKHKSADDELAPPAKKPKLMNQRKMQNRKVGFTRRVNSIGKTLWNCSSLNANFYIKNFLMKKKNDLVCFDYLNHFLAGNFFGNPGIKFLSLKTLKTRI
ncbi:hypothetical protein RFI_28629 [Reticulomyxa filosa]|uniref:Activator of basal transcription 1 n=1 Tax=Reticulomyxa filosa TaxID=46433 RepID=X6M439_RETFI|nr:hypothetical protein RFI_28629 [Reticulomyxa filosa]|eukprot:ETO08758.1 hypothetical protein RFI_28629 [Reticulomyxa filosa]